LEKSVQIYSNPLLVYDSTNNMLLSPNGFQLQYMESCRIRSSGKEEQGGIRGRFYSQTQTPLIVTFSFTRHVTLFWSAAIETHLSKYGMMLKFNSKVKNQSFFC
ncbi:hypothetical protein CR513_05705, partial [Mucuna pruriens]